RRRADLARPRGMPDLVRWPPLISRVARTPRDCGMARIQNYFDRPFRLLLASLGVPDVDHGMRTLRDAAATLRQAERLPMSRAVARGHVQLRRRATAAALMPKHFGCDAGLGGLARWLRAAGYDAAWQPELDDAAVIREAQKREATLLTTDTL